MLPLQWIADVDFRRLFQHPQSVSSGLKICFFPYARPCICYLPPHQDGPGDLARSPLLHSLRRLGFLMPTANG